MALAQLKRAVSATDVRRILEVAGERPDAALRDAFRVADELAPAVMQVIEQAANGVYLLPKQRNLFFWGIHALAAARRTELFQPLIRLLCHASEDDIDCLLGDGSTESLAGVLLSLFDGSSASLMEGCLDNNVCGLSRWILFKVLARL